MSSGPNAQSRLNDLGWNVMRFWVYEIRDDLPSCIAKVKKWQN